MVWPIPRQESNDALISRWFGPFHVENQMIVAIARDSGDGLGGVFLPVEIDEGESLGRVRDFVLSQVDSGDAAERPEEFLQIRFSDVLGKIGDSDRRGVVPRPVIGHRFSSSSPSLSAR